VFGADGPLELAPPDPVELADALLRMLDDAALRERRAAAGLAWVADKTWDHAAGQLEDGLRAALRERSGAPAPPVGAPAAMPAATAGADAYARSVPIVYPSTLPATDRLFARLDPADVAAVEARLDVQQQAYWNTADERHRRTLAIVYGVWHGVPAVLEKTGLRPEAPPDDVHAMARGPLAAGGAIYYADMLGDALQRVGAGFEEIGRGLDFGCSSGRVIRALAATWPQVEWHGCDPNGEAIEWAREHLPGIAFLRSPQDPPLPYDDATFDFVCAISIWSHYGEHAALGWLEEMRRIIRPGGRLVITSHGLQSIAYYARTGERSPVQLERIRAALYRTGFWFADEFGAEGDWGVRHPQWGTAFFTPEWLASKACPRWVIEDLAVGENADNQDLYVLRRR
jgi:SAM-dependent methyltransferase